MTFKEKVLNIMVNSPEELPLLIAKTHNKKFLMRILNSYMPYKTGIEIEANGSLSNILNKSSKALTKELGALQYHDDYAGSDHYINHHRNCLNKDLNEFCEHRLCISNWKQLIALKRMCILLQNHCAVNPTGGMHFHINTPELNLEDNLNKLHLSVYSHRKIEEALMVKINTDFLGKFEAIAVRDKYPVYAQAESKSNGINLRRMGTIEFRLHWCSFDYKHIVTNIINTQMIMRQVRASMGWKVDFEQV